MISFIEFPSPKSIKELANKFIVFVLYSHFTAYYVTNQFIKGGTSVKDYIEERAVEIAEHIISKQTTVRQTAKVFGVSKSTVHKDVTERLPKINPLLASKVKRILEKNKAERHIRGGKATKMKYSSVAK